MSVKDEEELQTCDETDPSDVSTFSPVMGKKLTEQESIQKSIQECQGSQVQETVPWPKIGNDPVNEFTTEGYITCAFPTLLPTDAGEFLAPRLHGITVSNYFKHLIKYGDGRFTKHPRFHYLALNTEMRWHALQTRRIYINKHPKDTHLMLDELQIRLTVKVEQGVALSACAVPVSTG